MRITILSHGSRGDIQPYLALGRGLARAGHTVRLAAPEIYRSWVIENHFSFAPLAGDPHLLMRQAARGSLLPGLFQSALTTLEYVTPVAAQLVSDIRAACCGSDAVIHSLLTTVIGHQVALEQHIPDLSALVFPVFSLTTAFRNPLFPAWPFGSRYNWLSHREFNRVFWTVNRVGINWLRRQFPDLPALQEWPFGDPLAPCSPCRTPILYGISQHTLPGLTEQVLTKRLTGYWFYDSPGWQPPDGLERFLDSGEKPVFVGFGSLIPKDAARLVRTALEALKRCGCRAVLLGGWGGLPAGSLPDSVYSIEDVPFDWLFPRVAAAVHHGGMGTTAAALRAGIPSVIVPFTFDQPFWGHQVHRLGAGPAPIPRSQLTADRLAQALAKALEDESIHVSTAWLGVKIRGEDGVTAAVQAIEQHLKT